MGQFLLCPMCWIISSAETLALSRVNGRAAMGRGRDLLFSVRLGRESNNKSTKNCNE